MIKAIIFDCFGVVFSDNFEENYEKFGGDAKKDKEFLQELTFDVCSGKVADASTAISKRLNIDIDEWKLANVSDRSFNTELLAYTQELRKNYKVGLLSNVGHKGLVEYMDYSVMEAHFDDIIESAKIGYAKPEARIYEIAADRLGVRLDECVFTDDRQHYVDGAIHVGMQAILFKNFDQFKAELERALG